MWRVWVALSAEGQACGPSWKLKAGQKQAQPHFPVPDDAPRWLFSLLVPDLLAQRSSLECPSPDSPQGCTCSQPWSMVKLQEVSRGCQVARRDSEGKWVCSRRFKGILQLRQRAS